MKSIKILASALALAALLLNSCTKEHFEGGIDLTKPGISDLSYGEFKHDSKSITISWSGTKAVAAGATSFSVQLSLNKEGHGVDMYDPSKGITVPAESGKSDYTATLNGQKIGEKYYVRVRANYPKSVYSDWTWVCDAAGNPAIYKVGRGFISEGIESPYVYKVTPTSTGLIIKWDPVAGASKYFIEYKLATASEWTVLEFGPNDATQTKINNLPSLTQYNVRAKCDTPEGMSDYSDVITVSTRQPGSYPKEMKTADELLAWLEGGVVEVDVNDVYSLANDIDLDGASFTAMDEPLLGTLDGKGFTVKGVSSTLLFQNEGTVKNLTIVGSYTVTGSMPETAAFVNVNKGKIENCTAKVDVKHAVEADADIYIAGFVYRNEGSITNCTNAGEVAVTAGEHNSRACIGGFASVNSGVLKGCNNNGNVSFTSTSTVHAPAVAGIAGFIDGTAEDCTNYGNVTLSALYCNGYGEYYESTIGKVSSTAAGATPAVGGIAAYSYSEKPEEALLTGCVNEGTVVMKFTTQDKYTTTVQRVQAAGIIANPWGLIKNCKHNGTLTVSILTSSGAASTGTFLTCIGGIGGGDWFPGTPNQGATSYDGCENNGSVNLENYDKAGSYSTAGGIVGWPGLEGARDNKTINCVSTGKVTLNGTAKARLGGIHGGSGRIDKCVSSGEVIIETGSDLSAAGGISGFSSNGFKITNSVSSGKIYSAVASTYGVAGLVGNLGNSANSGGFSGCSVAASVTNPESTNEHTGMIIGFFNGTSASVPVATPKIKGVISFGGKKILLTAGNYTQYLVGTANASASNHPIESTFDPTEYVDPDGDSGQPGGVTLEAPTNIAVSVMYNYVDLTWNAVEGAEWYVVEYKKKTDDEWLKSPQVTEPKCRIEGLEHGTDYTFRVKAFSTNASGYSDAVSESTLEEVNLTAPVIIGAVPTAKSADISWNEVEKATGYHIQYRKSGEDEWKDSGDAEKSPYTVNGLSPDATFEVRIKALGAGGNEGEYCDPYSFVTEALSFTYPLTIEDATDFATWVSSGAEFCTESDVVTLGKDFDLKGVDITPAPKFAGTLDGNGKILKNLSISNALFGMLEETAVVKNLSIDAGSTINWTDAIPDETGIAFVASKSNGKILNCNVAGKITVKSADAGRLFCAGIVGQSSTGYVEGCKFTGSIDVELTKNSKSCSAIAGVAARVGHADKEGQVIVKDCVNEGSVKFLFSGASKEMKKFGIGGVIGQTPSVESAPTSHGIIEGCVNRGNLEWSYPQGGSGSYPAFGGVAGLVEGQIRTCSNYGKLTYTGSKEVAATDGSIGGVAGYVTGNASDCHNYGAIQIDAAFAGGTAMAQSGGNTDYSAFGGVFGGAGPFISVADNYTKVDNTVEKGVTVSNCTNEAALVLTPSMATSGGPKMGFGGIVGTLTANIENCHNNAGISVKSGTRWIMAGGIAGIATGNVVNCTSKGNLSVDADSANNSSAKQQHYIGGLVGIIAKGATISNSHNSGNISLTNVFTTPGTLSYLGGLMGSYSGAVTMEDCSNSGTVTCDMEDPLCLGGIAAAFNGVMKNTKNSGKVVNASTYTSDTAGKESEIGGLVGYANAEFIGCENTGDVSSAASGSFVSGFVGGFGAADKTWAGCTVNCAVEGAATAKASVLGRFRNAGTNIVTLGAEGAPFTIKGGATANPICALDNGNTVSETNVVK